MEVEQALSPSAVIPQTPVGIHRGRGTEGPEVTESPVPHNNYTVQEEEEEGEGCDSSSERSHLHKEGRSSSETSIDSIKPQRPTSQNYQEPNSTVHEKDCCLSCTVQEGEGMVATDATYSLPSESHVAPDTDTGNDNMARKYLERCFELEVMANRCEMLRKKCLEECEAKYETLKKKYTEEQSEKEAALNEVAEARKKCVEVCEQKYETLMKKYKEECLERKRLYNALVEMKGNIRVFCRCRPLSREEASKGSSDTFDFDASRDTEMQIVCNDSSKKQFKFDHVFGPNASQESVFAETLTIIRSVLDGFNACIFAYGQTGSGKTFTMEGTDEDRGVNYRALQELFKIADERSPTMRYDFFVSMLEVYNEKIRDLLVDSSQQGKKLEIKQAAEGAQEVPGLVEAQAYNTNDVWELLQTGKQNRSVGSTNANELSSRSHCLLRVTIRGENMVSGQKSKSNLWLVDLAGSERLGKIEVEGERLKESQFINKSLSALGDVISALATKNSHIPYRNSKLTHLLQSSLGGDCKTLMFVQISPSSADLGETLCSLNFATRVRGIEQGPARRQLDPAESFKCKQLAEKLRQEEKENAKLNESLQLMQLKYASRENVFKTLQEKIKDLENQLADERHLRHQQENRDTTTMFHRPPLPPIKERPPLRKITANVLHPVPRRNGMTMMPPSMQDKENLSMLNKPANGAQAKAPLKAQRILVAPVCRPAAAAPRRRVSIASFPSYSQKATEAPNSHQNHSYRNVPGPFSKLPRRRSIMSFSSVPTTPVASTPVGGNRTSSIMGSCYSSCKYSSPQQHKKQPLWKSKISTFASPRQKFRLLSTPGSAGKKNSTSGKICFSVQKRLVIGSPPVQSQLQRPTMLGVGAMNQALSGKELLEKYGGAKRFLGKNSRKKRVSIA